MSIFDSFGAAGGARGMYCHQCGSYSCMHAMAGFAGAQQQGMQQYNEFVRAVAAQGMVSTAPKEPENTKVNKKLLLLGR